MLDQSGPVRNPLLSETCASLNDFVAKAGWRSTNLQNGFPGDWTPKNNFMQFADFMLLVGVHAPRHDVLSPFLAVGSEFKVFNYCRNWVMKNMPISNLFGRDSFYLLEDVAL